jgi:hypothetical protein
MRTARERPTGTRPSRRRADDIVVKPTGCRVSDSAIRGGAHRRRLPQCVAFSPHRTVANCTYAGGGAGRLSMPSRPLCGRFPPAHLRMSRKFATANGMARNGCGRADPSAPTRWTRLASPQRGFSPRPESHYSIDLDDWVPRTQPLGEEEQLMHCQGCASCVPKGKRNALLKNIWPNLNRASKRLYSTMNAKE